VLGFVSRLQLANAKTRRPPQQILSRGLVKRFQSILVLLDLT